jgi:hypothetical protein
VLPDVLGVHHGDDAVQPELALHLVVDEEGLGHRAGVGHARGFDEDVVELVPAFHQVAEDADQVAAPGAADATVVHLEDLFLGADDQLLVDADLAELVLDDGDALAVLGGEDVVEQGRLARPEEAGQDGDGDTGVVGGSRHGCSWCLGFHTPLSGQALTCPTKRSNRNGRKAGGVGSNNRAA